MNAEAILSFFYEIIVEQKLGVKIKEVSTAGGTQGFRYGT